MVTAAYFHLFVNSNNHKRTNETQCQERASIQQWLEEQLLFDNFGSNYATTLSVHIPICSSSPLKQYQRKKSSSKHRNSISDSSDKSLLYSTSKIPLNIGTLDDILFASTLQDDCTSSSARMSQSTKRPMTKTTEVKQHSSSHHHYQYDHPQEEEESYPTATTSRYSHPAAANNNLYANSCKQQRYNHIIQQPQQQPTSYDHFYFNTTISSSSSPSGIYHGSSVVLSTDTYDQQQQQEQEEQRRMSYQSDAALSTELIRRFSSGSTTSTVATSISSTSASASSSTTSSTLYMCPANSTLIDKGNNRSAQTQFNKSSTEALTTILKTEPPTATKEKVAEIKGGGDKEGMTNINNTLVGTTMMTREEQEEENKHFILSQSNNNKNIPNSTTAQITEQQQAKHRDPGHACDTTSMQQQQQQQHQQNRCSTQSQIEGISATILAYPIWADPIKIEENPTRYEKVIYFLQEHQISFESSLPLSKPCAFYFSDNSSSNKKNKEKDYMSAVKSVFTCDSVWQFSARWRLFKDHFNKKPSQLASNQNLFCFISGVEPMWEDPVNQHGGRFIISIQQEQMLDDLFEWLLLAFIGAGTYEDGVVGIAVSKRYRGDRIELWFDSSFTGDDCTLLDCFKEKLTGLLPKSCHNEINAGRYKKHF